jgi:small subunit ribosomal protein S16
MATRIRLARRGAKKKPFYRIIVTDSRSPRDGKFIEILGTYNPMLPKDDENKVVLKKDRIEHWISQGAYPSEKVAKLIALQNVTNPLASKLAKKKKSTERKVKPSKKSLKEASQQ